MWYQCCVCLPPVFLFSPPAHSALYQRAAASHSVYRHTSRGTIRKKKTKNHHDLHLKRVCTFACFWPPSVDMLLGSHNRAYSWPTPDTSLGRSLTKTEHSLQVQSMCVSTLKASVRSAYLPPWCGPACSPAAPPEALGTRLPGLPPLPPACCSPDWAARDTACTQTRLRLKLQLKSSEFIGKLPQNRRSLTGLWDP